MNPAIYALFGVIISVCGSIAVARLTNRALERRARTEGELGASQLAIRIANRADRKANHAEKRLDSYDRWRRSLTDVWWPLHDQRDRAIEEDLRRLDPHADIPPRVPMPQYQPPEFPAEEDDEEVAR